MDLKRIKTKLMGFFKDDKRFNDEARKKSFKKRPNGQVVVSMEESNKKHKKHDCGCGKKGCHHGGQAHGKTHS